MLIIPGRAALSAARKTSVLAKIREVSPHVTSLEARWVHMVVAERELTADELTQLGDMLSYGPLEAPAKPSRRRSAATSSAWWKRSVATPFRMVTTRRGSAPRRIR